jgi:hypothetical protein
MATGAVPGFPTMVATMDTIVSQALAQYNTTLPGGLALVHIMYVFFGVCQMNAVLTSRRRMLDASQFLRAEGFTKTLTTLGF